MSQEAKNVNKPVIIDQTAKVHVPVKGIIESGLKLAKTFMQAAKTQKISTLACALLLIDKGEDDVGDFLKAFREGLNNSSASVVSSKVKAVILAYRVPTFGRVVGIDEKTKELKKETKTGKAWLETHTGTFESMVTLAREIRGAQAGQGSGGGNTRKVKLTDADMEKIETQTKLASAAQTQEILARANDQLVATNPKAWEPFIIEQIDSLVKRLAMGQAELVYQKLAQEIRHVLDDHFAARNAMSAEVLAAVQVAPEVGEPVGPVPAAVFHGPLGIIEEPAFNVGQPYQFVEPQRLVA